MIREVTMYQAVCDGCGEHASQVASDVKTAIFSPINNERWVVINNMLYCPDCYEYDEETDEYKPKKKD